MWRYVILLFLGLALLGCSNDQSADVVGTWAADYDHSSMPNVKPEQLKLVQMMFANARVEVREDGSFKLNLMADLEGTWKYDGKSLYLKSDKPLPRQLAATTPNGEIQFEVNASKGTLAWPLTTPFGDLKLLLVRAPSGEVQATP